MHSASCMSIKRQQLQTIAEGTVTFAFRIWKRRGVLRRAPRGAPAVDWGLAHRLVAGVQALGIDEIAWKKGHKYLTLVYRVDAERRRLLWIGQGRQAGF